MPRSAAPAPYYPRPSALDHALARALAAGARLDALRPRLREVARARLEVDADARSITRSLVPWPRGRGSTRCGRGSARSRARLEVDAEALEVALALATLGFLGERSEAGAERLVALQRADGSWPAAVLWTGPGRPRRPRSTGAPRS